LTRSLTPAGTSPCVAVNSLYLIGDDDGSTLAEHGVTIGWSSMDFEKDPKTCYFSTTPYKITFKSNHLTGSQSDDDRYEYYVATGQLIHFPAPPKT